MLVLPVAQKLRKGILKTSIVLCFIIYINSQRYLVHFYWPSQVSCLEKKKKKEKWHFHNLPCEMFFSCDDGGIYFFLFFLFYFFPALF